MRCAPMVPPIWRKNVEDPVATPISGGGTAHCRISSSGCMQFPSPRPRMNIDQ